MTDYPNPTTSHDPNDNTIRVANPVHEDWGDVAPELCICLEHPHENWPGDNGNLLCQDCWEHHADAAWWEHMSVLEAVIDGDEEWLRDNGYLEAS